MKKILFFSLEDGWLGGIASVNGTLGPALEAEGFLVKNLFLRGCDYPLPPSEKNTVLRKGRPWNYVHGSQILGALKQGRLVKGVALGARRIFHTLLNKVDFYRAKLHLLAENPDAIVVSSYLLLDAVPKSLYARTLHHVHTSFDATMAQKANRKTLERYNGKIGFLWLSEGICKKARETGFENSFYLYNPLSHFPEKGIQGEKMSTVSVITRFSPEKRLPLAVELLKKAMDRLEDPNAFTVEFWGAGPEEEAIRKAVGEDPRFRIKGQTKAPFDVLAHSRFTVNTSLFEGFSISVLEAAAAGVPTVSFRFGEAAEEEILHGKTGLIAEMDDTRSFEEFLFSLLTDDDLCRRLSQGAREHAERFRKEVIARDWKTLVFSLPLDKREKR